MLAERYSGALLNNLHVLSRRNDSSYILRSVSNLFKFDKMENLLKNRNFKWNLQNGEIILFWEDWWHNDGILKEKMKNLYKSSLLKFSKVSSFLTSWNSDSVLLWNKQLEEVEQSEFQILQGLMSDLSLNIRTLLSGHQEKVTLPLSNANC